MSDNIIEFLKTKGLLPSRHDFRVTPLIGGFWNDVFRLQGPGRDWAVKRFRVTASEGLYPILPVSEAMALQNLSGSQIAPEPVAFFESEQILVYHYVDGNTWRGDVAPVGRLLHRLGQLPVDPDAGFRRLPLDPSDILRQGDQLLAQANPDPRVSRLRSRRPSERAWPAARRLSLVHTDAWAGNFIQGEFGRLCLIDWQCPGLGDPAEDAWTFIDSGYEMLLGRPRHDQTTRDRFLEAYGEPSIIERIRLLNPYYAYRVAAHCCLRRQQLAGTNPVASRSYQNVYSHLIDTLER